MKDAFQITYPKRFAGIDKLIEESS